MSADLQQLENLAARARVRIRVRDALAVAGKRLLPVLLGGMLLVVVAELFGGLEPSAVVWFVLLLLWPTGFVVAGLLRALPITQVALQLDAAAGTKDRLGTALALAGQSGALVEAQRRDALSMVGGLTAAKLLPLLPPSSVLTWKRSARAALGFCLLTGLALWTPPRVEEPDVQAIDEPSALERAADRLMADIGGLEDALVDAGDVRSLQLLDDLRARVRRVRNRERNRQAAAPPPPPEPEESNPVVEVQPQPTPAAPALLTAEDLLRMESQLAENLVADAQNQMGRDLLQTFGDALATNKQAAQIMAGMSAEIGQQSLDQAMFDGVDALGQTASFNQLMADLNMSDSGDQSMNDFSRITDQIEENITANMNRMDVDAMPAQEAQHAMQESFQEFLKEYVKEIGEMVARASMGRQADEPDESNTVRTTGGGNGEQDEGLPMDPQAGFREVEEGDGDASSSSPTNDPGGEPSSSQGGPAIAPPEGSGPGQAQAAPPGAAPTAMAEGAMGETSLGAQGAGSGAGPAGGAEGAQSVQQGGARLERLLGQLSEGRLPPEQREQIYDRVGRHNVAGGTASDFDDPMMRDYFSRADTLLAESEDILPPAFRSYIQDYFDALAEGAEEASQ